MKRLLMAASAVALLGSAAAAQDIVQTRIAAMKAVGGGLGTLGGMVRGRADYDASAADAAAQAIVAALSADAMTLFPEGTDDMSIDGTRAQANIWDNWDDFAAKFDAMVAAAGPLAAAAGTGKAEMTAAFGPFAGTCRDCHQTYRAPKN